MCGTSFSARADAVYCSPACRQKAHRARTARRTAELRAALERTSGPEREKVAASRSLQLSVARSMQRAREQVDRSRELCRASEWRVEKTSAFRQELARIRARDAATMPSTKAVLWRGN
jgi:hypothetical protein